MQRLGRDGRIHIRINGDLKLGAALPLAGVEQRVLVARGKPRFGVQELEAEVRVEVCFVAKGEGAVVYVELDEGYGRFPPHILRLKTKKVTAVGQGPPLKIQIAVVIKVQARARFTDEFALIVVERVELELVAGLG